VDRVRLLFFLLGVTLALAIPVPGCDRCGAYEYDGPPPAPGVYEVVQGSSRYVGAEMRVEHYGPAVVLVVTWYNRDEVGPYLYRWGEPTLDGDTR
jgi:hypothetical protein